MDLRKISVRGPCAALRESSSTCTAALDCNNPNPMSPGLAPDSPVVAPRVCDLQSTCGVANINFCGRGLKDGQQPTRQVEMTLDERGRSRCTKEARRPEAEKQRR